MLGKIASFTATTTIIGSYLALRNYPMSLSNPYLQSIFSTIRQHRPEYAKVLLKTLLKLKILAKDDKLDSYVLGSGLDIEGHYLCEFMHLGFKGLQVGPVSLNPSQQEEPVLHLGIKAALANIFSFRQSQPGSAFQIHLRIVPNLEVLKYVPYLLPDNLSQSIQAYTQIQKLTPINILNRINMDFDYLEQKLLDQNEPETIKMIETTKNQISLLLNQIPKSAPRIEYNSKGVQYLSWPDLLGYLCGERNL